MPVILTKVGKTPGQPQFGLVEEGSLQAIDIGRYSTRKYYRILKESLVAYVRQKSESQ